MVLKTDTGWFAAFVITLVALPGTEAHAETPRRLSDVMLEFVSKAEASDFLGASDRFTSRLSPVDLQARLKSSKRLSERDYLQSAAASAREWSTEERDRLSRLWKELGEAAAKYRLPFPTSLQLIKTDGSEEAHAAYCRGLAIILPVSRLSADDDDLLTLLAHESFHIASRFSSSWRTKVYATIGFQTCAPIAFPKALQSQRLTNPDAPLIDCYIIIGQGADARPAAPVVLSRVAIFDPQKYDSLFKVLQFRLLPIERVEDAKNTWQPMGKITSNEDLIDPRRTPSYWRQVGMNTGYVIHPDEILADNFAMLVDGTDRSKVRSPTVLDEIESVLQQENGADAATDAAATKELSPAESN